MDNTTWAVLYGVTYGMGMILMLITSSELKDTSNQSPAPYQRALIALAWLPLMLMFFIFWLTKVYGDACMRVGAAAKTEWELRRKLWG